MKEKGRIGLGGKVCDALWSGGEGCARVSLVSLREAGAEVAVSSKV